MIGIITAIEEEFNALRKVLKNTKETVAAQMPFVKGTINNRPVTLAMSGEGKVNAACCAQILIDRFIVDGIINVGIGGSLTPELNIADIVISDDSVQYDMDATAFDYEIGEIPNLGKRFFKADDTLIKYAEESSKKNNIPYKIGRVMTADLLLSDSAKKEEIVNEFGGIICEMEGAAIAQVCYLNQIPYLIIRSVSDSADEDAKDSINENAIDSSERTVNLVEGIINQIPELII